MKNLSNEELVSHLVELARNERLLLGEVLRHLREVEERKLHLKMAYPSLYEFSMKKLGYSDWEAHVRIQAMRLTMSVPEAEKKLENGELTLTAATKAQTHFRRAEKNKTPVAPARKKEIIESLCGTTTREAERKLAELFPGEPAKETVKETGKGNVKVEFTIGPELWKTMQELFDVRSHANPNKRWDKMLEDLSKLGWKKWHHNPQPNESPWAPHVDLH